MSRHHRKTETSNTRSRIVLGGAMTAVFLSGGAGVALADSGHDGQRGTGNTSSNARGGDTSNDAKGGLLGQVTGPLLSGNTGQLLSDNSFLNDNLNDLSVNILSHQNKDDDKKHGHKKHESKKHEGHKGSDRDDCGCEDEKPAKHRHDEDCDDDHGKKVEDSDDDEKSEAKDDDEKDETEAKDDSKADDSKADEAKDDAKSDDSTPEVKAVSDSTDTGGAGDTPVGAADTGDGSFIGGVAPVASSWSMADTMFAAGGGLGAAALLAGGGVGVGRHRRASHRASA